MLYRIAAILLVVFFCACQSPRSSAGDIRKPVLAVDDAGYEKVLLAKEKEASDRNYAEFGSLVKDIPIRVKTNDLESYREGYVPAIGIESPDKELKLLIDKDKTVIDAKKITVVIDYPLTNSYTFNLNSSNGFTSGQLVKEISKNYHHVYEEEEATANIKTIPAGSRKHLANRNQTDGKYGIWGHDMAQLTLTDIKAYKTADGNIVLCLNIES